MKTNFFKLGAIFIVLSTILIGSVDSSPSPKKNDNLLMKAAAEEGLKTFQNLLTQGGNRSLGFAMSQTQIDGLKLGEPIAVTHVGLQALKTYKSGTETTLLNKVNQQIYRILYNGAVVKSEVIELNPETKVWEVASFGDNALLQSVEEFKSDPHFTSGGLFLVMIPGFSMDFLAGESGGTLYMTYLSAQPFGGISQGTTMTMDSVFKQLKPIAAYTTIL